jgi:parallel beta-helix repeat protein
MRRTIVLLATMALTVLVASGVALATAIGSAQAANKVVGPGESIQKAVNAADPGDTIVVRGVHREDVIITKNGIKLRGEGDAVIEAPARAGSPCSKFGGVLVAICVVGDFNPETGEITGPRVRDVSISGFTFRGFNDKGAFVIDVVAARNVTVVGNRITGNVANGIAFGLSVNSTIANNHVIGSPEPAEVGILDGGASRNTKIVNNVVRGYDLGIEVGENTNTTIAGNDSIGNRLGVLLIDSTGTKILSNDITDTTEVGTVILDSTGTKMVSNDISRYGDAGISIFGPKPANLKVVGNNISGGPAGIYVADTKGGSFAGNTIHDNCAGMFFEADGSKEPVSGFEVKANTVENNTRLCRGGFEGKRNVSGIGIALLGTTDMEVTGNHLSGNVPSGPTSISGGVVVSTDPGFGGSAKLRNNSVIGNHFGHNKPDIFWDETGSGNSFVGNLCNTSVPSRLCN